MSTRELIYIYKVRCLTEGIDYEIHANMNNIPTNCPVQPYTHIIDSNNIQIINKNYQEYIDIPKVVIQESTEDVTQGYFRVRHYTFACPSNTTTNYDFTFKYPVNISAVKLLCNEENDKDIINSYGIVSSPIGIITSNVNIGDTTIYVNSTVQQYMSIGANLLLTNFVNTEDLGEILTMYTDRVVVNTPTTQNWTTGNTYVKMQVNNIVDFELHKEVPLLSLGDSKVGGSIIKPGVIIRVSYSNISLNTDKNFSFFLEYTY